MVIREVMCSLLHEDLAGEGYTKYFRVSGRVHPMNETCTISGWTRGFDFRHGMSFLSELRLLCFSRLVPVLLQHLDDLLDDLMLRTRRLHDERPGIPTKVFCSVR